MLIQEDQSIGRMRASGGVGYGGSYHPHLIPKVEGVSGLCRAIEYSDSVAGNKRQEHRGDGQRPEHLWRREESIDLANFSARAGGESDVCGGPACCCSDILMMKNFGDTMHCGVVDPPDQGEAETYRRSYADIKGDGVTHAFRHGIAVGQPS